MSDDSIRKAEKSLGRQLFGGRPRPDPQTFPGQPEPKFKKGEQKPDTD